MTTNTTRGRRGLAGAGAALMAAVLSTVLFAPPAHAATVFKTVNWDGKSCTGSERFTIISEAQGIVKHQTLMGPPHLGYKWKGAKVGQSMAMVYDTSYTNKRSVYNARVVASTFNGRKPIINRAYGTCA